MVSNWGDAVLHHCDHDDRIRKHCTKNSYRSPGDNAVCHSWDSSHVVLFVKHWQCYGSFFQVHLLETLLCTLHQAKNKEKESTSSSSSSSSH